MITVITDILRGYNDEGAKIATFNLLSEFKKKIDCKIITIGEHHNILSDRNYNINRMFVDINFYRSLRREKSDKILYIPEASLTFGTVIRTKLLKLFTGKDVIVLSLQPRKYSCFLKLMIKLMKPDFVVAPSKESANYLRGIGIKSAELSLGVDLKIFKEVEEKEILRLKEKHSINCKRKVLLHVGHLRESRNLEWLIDVKSQIPEVEIVVVGSSYSPEDKRLRQELISNGIVVLTGYMEKIEEIYNIADCYVFPVVRDDGCIATPLSVLEAMACNIPVITTRFGSLPDTFVENDHFRFVSSSKDIVNIVNEYKTGFCDNRSKVALFSWNKVAAYLENIIGLNL